MVYLSITPNINMNHKKLIQYPHLILVKSTATTSFQASPIPFRRSPMRSTHSSCCELPWTSVSLSYHQASVLPGFRSSIPTHCYDEDEVSTSINAIPWTINRSWIGLHESLSESIQSLRSNHQSSLALPMKKRSNDLTK